MITCQQSKLPCDADWLGHINVKCEQRNDRLLLSDILRVIGLYSLFTHFFLQQEQRVPNKGCFINLECMNATMKMYVAEEEDAAI